MYVCPCSDCVYVCVLYVCLYMWACMLTCTETFYLLFLLLISSREASRGLCCGWEETWVGRKVFYFLIPVTKEPCGDNLRKEGLFWFTVQGDTVHHSREVWWQEPEVAAHTATTLRKLGSFSPFYMVWDSRLGNYATHRSCHLNLTKTDSTGLLSKLVLFFFSNQVLSYPSDRTITFFTILRCF